MNYENPPLNINLIIPFKDNKGEHQILFLGEIDRFKLTLEKRADTLKGDLVDLFGNDFELNIAARSDGNAKRYYWRFKSSKRDRKFNRLNADSNQSYISLLDDSRKLRLKEMEEELIYINANLKVIKSMTDAIEQSKTEQEALRETNFQMIG